MEMRLFRNWPGFFTFIIILICVYCHFNEDWILNKDKIPSQILLNILGSIIGGSLLYWLGFLNRFRIRQAFGFFDPIIARVPLMLSCAPLFVAKKLNYWGQHDLDVDLDFRYAGVSTLMDLQNNKCQLAVASDVATVVFMHNLKASEAKYSIRVLPFVKISNHLKFLVRNDSTLVKIDDLKDKNIAYLKGSVHDDYLKNVEKNIKGTLKQKIEKEDIMNCYHALRTNEVDACILWEPHYFALEQYDMRILEDFNEVEASYTWFLCLIAEDKYIREHPKAVRSIFNVMKIATDRCETSTKDIIDSCSLYLESEFTGLKPNGLKKIIDINKHRFSIDKQMKKDYNSKLEALRVEYGFGVGKLLRDDALWPEFK